MICPVHKHNEQRTQQCIACVAYENGYQEAMKHAKKEIRELKEVHVIELERRQATLDALIANAAKVIGYRPAPIIITTDKEGVESILSQLEKGDVIQVSAEKDS